MRSIYIILAAIVFAVVLAALVRAYLVYHAPRDGSAVFSDAFTSIAHRGGANLAPENTMAAFRLAAGLGDAFELDVNLSKDGQLVVIHDDTLGRTTGGTGPVSGMTAAELAALDAGSHFSSKYVGEGVSTLDEVLDRFALEHPIIIEVKCRRGSCDSKAISKTLVDLLTQKKLGDKVLVASFNPFVLSEVKKLDPSILRAQIYSDFASSDKPFYEKFALKNLLFNRFTSPDVLMVESSLVDEDYVKKMHGLKYRVFVWTVDDAFEMERLIALGVDGIITNDPVLLQEIRHGEKRG